MQHETKEEEIWSWVTNWTFWLCTQDSRLLFMEEKLICTVPSNYCEQNKHFPTLFCKAPGLQPECKSFILLQEVTSAVHDQRHWGYEWRCITSPSCVLLCSNSKEGRSALVRKKLHPGYTKVFHLYQGLGDLYLPNVKKTHWGHNT